MRALNTRLASLEAAREAKQRGPYVWGCMVPGETREAAVERVQGGDTSRQVFLWQPPIEGEK